MLLTMQSINKIKLPNLLGVYLKIQNITKINFSLKSEKPKTFLVDTFNRRHNYLRISLTEKCNLRCIYCMPEEGIPLTPSEKMLTSEEILRIASLFVKKFHINKIRLTGGEPLIRKDIISIVNQMHNQLKPFGLNTIAITTNGVALNKRCAMLKEAGINAVNISLDSLVPAKFEFINRRLNSFKAVMKSIDTALAQNFEYPVKLNCVIMKGFNDDELVNFVEFTKNKPIDIRFIEYMPFDGNKWTNDKLFSYEQMLSIIQAHYSDQFKIITENGKQSFTSKPYKVSGYMGQIGFITSMTNNFCATCNRLRITADGNLKVCLFDQKEVSLRDYIRAGCTDNQLIETIQNALSKKKAKHSGMLNIAKAKNRPMILIGG